MNKFELPYSLKNIPIPSKLQYKRQIISKVEKIVNNLRWKWYFICHPTNNERKETYGFKTNNRVPNFKELEKLKPFEDSLLDLVENIKYRPTRSQFQTKLREDCKIIRNEKNVIAKSDKTSNLYLIPPVEYTRHVNNNVTKDYRKCEKQRIYQINKEAADIAKKLDLDERIEVLSEPPCYVTIKDHKDDFPGKLSLRLINPAKTKIGIISKQILDRINHVIRNISNSNQWQNTQQVIKWFQKMPNKKSLKFFQFDIENFYASISENLLNKALEFASQFVKIDEEEKKIILHSRKTILFWKGDPWTKKNGEDFDVPMGAYDSAEVSELVGLYLLNQLENVIPQTQVGLYRDDGLAVLNLTGSQIDRVRKKIIQIFQQNGLKIKVHSNIKTVNFLDITLDLKSNSYKIFRKENHKPCYINIESNHPPKIKKELPKMIERRLVELSSSKEMFEAEKIVYEDALKSAGYKYQISFNENNVNHPQGENQRRKRSRKIIWFNPPYNASVSTNVASEFLKLLDKHFSKSSGLHKYFNRNTIKIAYSCMPNLNSIISSHNKKILGNNNEIEEKGCNCRAGRNYCPMGGKCLTESLVYKAEVTTESETKQYIGITANTFKERYNGHMQSFRRKNYNSTGLSNFIWYLKDKNKQFKISWSIMSLQPSFDPGKNKCQLCLTEKTLILDSKNDKSLNKRHEIFTKCRHRRKYLLYNCAM